ncbi:hypothetical protein PCE1_002712 [Barthelona sp. PCE]
MGCTSSHALDVVSHEIEEEGVEKTKCTINSTSSVESSKAQTDQDTGRVEQQEEQKDAEKRGYLNVLDMSPIIDDLDSNMNYSSDSNAMLTEHQVMTNSLTDCRFESTSESEGLDSSIPNLIISPNYSPVSNSLILDRNIDSSPEVISMSHKLTTHLLDRSDQLSLQVRVLFTGDLGVLFIRTGVLLVIGHVIFEMEYDFSEECFLGCFSIPKALMNAICYLCIPKGNDIYCSDVATLKNIIQNQVEANIQLFNVDGCSELDLDASVVAQVCDKCSVSDPVDCYVSSHENRVVSLVPALLKTSIFTELNFVAVTEHSTLSLLSNPTGSWYSTSIDLHDADVDVDEEELLITIISNGSEKILQTLDELSFNYLCSLLAKTQCEIDTSLYTTVSLPSFDVIDNLY